MSKKSSITTYIVIAMILGGVVGYACHTAFPDPKLAKDVACYISVITDVFLRLIKMIIAPLVFSTLVMGIAHMGDASTVGRVGVKALAWFITASLVSLTLGLIMATVLASPIWAMPMTSVEKTSGAMIILISRRKTSVMTEM